MVPARVRIFRGIESGENSYHISQSQHQNQSQSFPVPYNEQSELNYGQYGSHEGLNADEIE